MALDEVRVSGLQYLSLATQLLQRARLADPDAGVWEAADLQWWWRRPRRSDAMEQRFFVDGDGPAAAVVVTDWSRAWGVDPIAVPGVVDPHELWSRARDGIETLGLDAVEVLVRDDDAGLADALTRDGFVAGERSGIAWMGAADRPEPAPLPDGFVLVDRVSGSGTPHPLRRRNGDTVEERLRECSLYDPSLDLAVETRDGEVAGYALFWFDPVTTVGLLEPMRVEDAFQRRGLARALLTSGLERLAARGARRLKVGYATEPARNLYVGAGFAVAATCTSYEWRRR